VVDFVEICNVCAREVIIEAAKRVINSDKVCRSYSDLNFGLTFLEHSVYSRDLFCNVVLMSQVSNRILEALPLRQPKMNYVDLLSSVWSWLMGNKNDEPPKPRGDRQPEGGRDRGNLHAVNELDLTWERTNCLESPTADVAGYRHDD